MKIIIVILTLLALVNTTTMGQKSTNPANIKRRAKYAADKAKKNGEKVLKRRIEISEQRRKSKKKLNQLRTRLFATAT